MFLFCSRAGVEATPQHSLHHKVIFRVKRAGQNPVCPRFFLDHLRFDSVSFWTADGSD
jgi:hypothetical protein